MESGISLRMIGVEIDGSPYIYEDNMSVIHNTSKPESMLKKNSNRIFYHFVREAVAMKELLTTHVPTLNNWVDLLTKLLYVKKRQDLVNGILYGIYDCENISSGKSTSLIRSKLEATSKFFLNVKGLFSNGASTLVITTTGILVLQPLRWCYNQVTYENDVTTHVLCTFYVSLYVLCPCPMDMLP